MCFYIYCRNNNKPEEIENDDQTEKKKVRPGWLDYYAARANHLDLKLLDLLKDISFSKKKKLKIELYFVHFLKFKKYIC